MSIFRSRVTAVVAGAATVVALGATGAVAGDLIGSKDVQDDSLRGVDVHNGSLGFRELNDYTKDRINRPGPQGEQGEPGQDGADGNANPSAAGAGYTQVWAPNSFGESIQKCPAGEYVTGGGYSMWGGYPTNGSYDLGGENLDIEVTVSAPYIKGDYVPISDTDSRFYADQWVVRGFNHGDTEQIVRAWVLCAPVS